MIFVPGSRNTFKFFIKHSLPACAGLALVTLAGGVLIPLEIRFRGNLIDSILAAKSSGRTILWLILFFVGLAIYNNFSGVIQELLKLKMKYTAAREVIPEINKHRACLEYQYYESSETYNLLQRVYSADTKSKPDEIMVSTCWNFFRLLSIAVQSVWTLQLVSKAGWHTGMIIAVLSVISCIVAIYGSNRVYEARQTTSEADRRAAYYEEILSNRENVSERKLFSYMNFVSEKWKESFSKSLKTNINSSIAFRIRNLTTQFSGLFFSIMIICLSLKPLAEGRISTGFFISVFLGMATLSNSLNVLLPALVSELASNDRYFKDYRKFLKLNTIPDMQIPSRAKSNTETEIRVEPIYSIEFKNVSFMYPGTDRYVLRDLSFRFTSDRHYAIVGANGSGKSTLIKLMAGLYKPTEGDILINGKSIGHYTRSQLNCMFSIVFQDFARYYVTVRENILMGRNEGYVSEGHISDALIRETALKLGLDTGKVPLNAYLGKIFDGGIDISGGQWQLLALTRAFIADANTLVLDEPTAALDPVNETRLYNRFVQLAKEKMTILISHRLGSTKLADEILLLDSGRLTETGTHDELMKKAGLYSTMFNNQAEWYL
ncbi:ABC transporter ATP-binding protein [Ruminiclostridium cellobioparum]|uniref:ABC transporter ATP-binding protein n=1 Tax=Ruminiclostridium cellobioparum subsp. termitidis CT1112 TaxID=1195236 RepID=S0FGJ5_RUMCE|nr:ABC transporter ATP-binding protein [Ruminiclostridium cellobioparum]EMS70192.1 ABC transporter ATP-binding protein [Ruminiclostridium cellobioparum subsp. termitidis CT1112]